MTKRQFEKVSSEILYDRFEITEDVALAIVKYAPVMIYKIANPSEKVAKAIEKHNTKTEIEVNRMMGVMNVQNEVAQSFRNLLKYSGVKYCSTSKTSFGVSVYGEYKGRKVRISDHSTGINRMMQEVQFHFRTPQEMPERLTFNF